MRRAHRERRRHRDVGQAEILQRPAHQRRARLAGIDRLAHVQVQHRAAGVFRLQLFLLGQRAERVVRVADGQLRRVRVIRLVVRACLQDPRVAAAILAREAVRRALRRRRLQVEHVARGLLEFDEPRADVVQQPHGHRVPAGRGDVVGVDREIAHHLVDAVDPQRGKVIVQAGQPPLRVRVQARVDERGDGPAPRFEHPHPQGEELVEFRQQGVEIPGVEEAQPRAVHRDHADGTGQLRRAEEAVAAGQQLPQVQLEAAAHRADLARVEVGVDEVLEVRQAVARSHVEQAARVRVVPVEVGGDVVRGDGERERASRCVAAAHDLDERAVEQVHLRLQVAVGEVNRLVADERDLVAQLRRADPVEGQVRERSLRAPARGHVEVEHELLDRLLDLVVREAVDPDEGREVRVEAGERLRARPFVLQRAQEVDHLAQRRGEVLRRGGGHRAGDAAEALLEQCPQRPAGAVSGEHVQVVDVDGAFAVRGAGLGREHVVQPVVRHDFAGGVQHHAAQAEVLVRVGVDPPVGVVEVLVDRRARIDEAGRVGDGGACAVAPGGRGIREAVGSCVVGGEGRHGPHHKTRIT